MKKIKLIALGFQISALLVLSSCSYNSRSMSDSNARFLLEKGDVTISESQTASAKELLVFGIDWKRLFKREIGEVKTRRALVSFPLIGATPTTRAAAYATYNLLKENSDYDAVLYPQFEGTSKSFFPFFQKTEVTVKAKMLRVNP